MKRLFVTVLFLLLPVVAHAQIQAQPLQVLDYSPAVTIPQGSTLPTDFPTPFNPPLDDPSWLTVTIPVPAESRAVSVGFNTLSVPAGISYILILYAYDASGNFIHSVGSISQTGGDIVDENGNHHHARELTMSGWTEQNGTPPQIQRPTTIVYYARASQPVTLPSWIVSR